ncbi:MAG: sodium-dependent transporter, partial [Desulfovibrionaceae bacterium]|nr:sodium-dependent transporter [Desulfovibrionaceae bacterium]
FNQMPMGNFWGCLFFVFMGCAALTTVIAVMENIVSYSMDVNGWQRKSSIVVHLILMSILIMPCILGFNVLKDITPFGPGSCILDLEDFIVSNNVLPLGSLCMLIYCTSRYGWGWKNFVTETDKGKGPKFPHWARFYLTWILPIVILVLFINGYIDKFF